MANWRNFQQGLNNFNSQLAQAEQLKRERAQKQQEKMQDFLLNAIKENYQFDINSGGFKPKTKKWEPTTKEEVFQLEKMKDVQKIKNLLIGAKIKSKFAPQKEIKFTEGERKQISYIRKAKQANWPMGKIEEKIILSGYNPRDKIFQAELSGYNPISTQPVISPLSTLAGKTAGILNRFNPFNR